MSEPHGNQYPEPENRSTPAGDQGWPTQPLPRVPGAASPGAGPYGSWGAGYQQGAHGGNAYGNTGYAPASPARRRGPSIAAAAVAVIAAVAGVTIGHAVWHSSPSAASSSITQGSGNVSGGGSTGTSGTGNTGSSAAGAVSQKVDPALVDINSTFSFQSAQGAGTGIVLTSNGEILTNNHVINGATSISVTDIGNGKTYTADVVGYDASHDIAVLQLQNASGLATASIDAASPAVGQAVTAIGNAGGAGGTPSTAPGTVTALNQSITANDELDGTAEQLSGLIQVNANVQPGDSGGSLVNASGQVVGVDTAASQHFSLQPQNGGNNGFAIPIATATSIAQQIEAGNASATVHVGPTAFLGVLVESSSGQGANAPGGAAIPGAVISQVVPNGAAQQAGLLPGDVITSLNGQSVSSAADLSAISGTLKPGQSVPIGYTDVNGLPQNATIVLGSGPPA